jgi:hypothetical protein
MIAQVIAVLLLAYRLFIMYLVEFAIIDKWPFILSECPSACAERNFPNFCKQNCEFRKSINMDMTEYLAIDPVISRLDDALRANILSIVIFTTPLITIAVIGLLFRYVWFKFEFTWFRKTWAAKIGLFTSGMYFIQMFLFFVSLWISSPQPLTVTLYNIQDMIFAIFIGLWSWSRISANVTTYKQKKH